MAVTLLVSALLPASGWAEEELRYSVLSKFGVRLVDGENASARFNEYRSIRDGLYGEVSGFYDAGGYYVDLESKDILRNDQSYRVRGGGYGSYRYALLFNQTPHDVTYGARTFYANPGDARLEYTLNPTTSSTDSWNSFDYTMKLKDLGGEIHLTRFDPFYVSFGVNRLTQAGIRPVAGGAVELPEPVDYATTAAFGDLNYRRDNVFASFRASFSNFRNENEFFSWRMTSGSLYETTSVAPGNDLVHLLAQTSVSDLPLRSNLSARAGVSTLSNEFAVRDQIVSGATMATLALNEPNYKGKVKYNNAAVALSSRPIEDLSTKLNYSFIQRKDESSQIVFTNGAARDTTENFSYRKHLAGFEGAYRLPFESKATAGFEFGRAFRDRADATETTDRKYYAKVRNGFLEFLSGNLKVSRLVRTSVAGDSEAAWRASAASASGKYAVERYFRYTDLADRNENRYSIGVDIEPTDRISVGLEYGYKRNDYPSTILGRLEDSRQEGYANVSWELPNIVTVSGFTGVERVINSNYRRVLPNTVTVPNESWTNPSTPPNVSAGYYNLGSTLNDFSVNYGLTCDVTLKRRRLNLILSWEQLRSDGNVIWTPQAEASSVALGNINNYDDYRKSLFNAKAVYRHSEELTGTLGFQWERLIYSDLQFDNYLNRLTSPAALLTGAYSDQNYAARTLYLEASYRF